MKRKLLALSIALVPVVIISLGFIASDPLSENKTLVEKIMLPTFEFRGHKIGDPIDQIFPNWTKDSGCRKGDVQGDSYCFDKVTSIGDIRIENLYYNFLDGRFVRLTIWFGEQYHNSMLNMLRGKYGAPSKQDIDTLHNRAGAEFESMCSKWDFKEGTLTLEQRGDKIDVSRLSFSNPEATLEWAKRKEKKRLSLKKERMLSKLL